MNEQIKQKWIEKLESGEYPQGQGGLRIKNKEGGPDQFCCLGVLADIINPNGWRPPIDRWYKNEEITCYTFGEHGCDGYLPENIAEEVGLLENEQTKFACMNDEGKKFHEIAREIRNRL